MQLFATDIDRLAILLETDTSHYFERPLAEVMKFAAEELSARCLQRALTCEKPAS